jgi:ABC-type uncharacterized transport system permease subunit
MNFTSGITSSILIGIIYGIGTVGFSLIYRYLKFPDLSTIMSIVVGSIATATFTSKFGILTGILAGFVFGGLIGLATSLQIVFAKIPPILAGIISATAAYSLAFFLSSNQAVVDFPIGLRIPLNNIVSNVFSIQSLLTLIGISLLICWVISWVFSTKYGLYILALFGSENYLANRHRKREFATFSLLIIGNAIIGFSGGLAAIQNNTAVIPSHIDFLSIALAAYSCGNFLMHLIAKPNIRQFLDKDTKPSALFWASVNFVSSKARLNDENPTKIFYTLFSYVIFAMLINILFKTVEINLGGDNHSDWAIKAGIFFIILFLTTILDNFLKKSE